MKLRYALAVFVLSLGVLLPRPALANQPVCDPDCTSACAGTDCGGGTYHASCCGADAGNFCSCNCNWQNQPDC
jgi:hypothetical protein